MHPRSILALALATLLLAGCGGAGSTDGPDDSGGGISHPAGDALVLRVEQRGGFVAPAADLTRLPSFTLLGDGRVIQPGAVMAIFPGPMMPPLTVRRLNEGGVQAVLREVAATGLFRASRQFNAARDHVADAPDTVFELHADGAEVILSVYALGIGGGDNGLPADEARAHALLTNLDARLASLETWLPAGAWAEARSAPFQAAALRLLVRDASDEGADPSGIGFNLVSWPTSADPRSGSALGEWRCSIVDGSEAAAWNAQLGSANTLTRWTRGADRYQVLPLPLLPDQARSC
jgi:hypothetical protein